MPWPSFCLVKGWYLLTLECNAKENVYNYCLQATDSHHLLLRHLE